MATLLRSLDAVMDWLLRTSWQAGVLAILVLSATWLLRRWLPASARYGLLLLVAARLLMPVMPKSQLSLFNLFEKSQPPAPTQVANDLSQTGDWIITKEPLGVSTLTVLPANPSAPIFPTLFTWRTTLAAVWLLGIAIVLSRIAHANFILSRKIRRAAAVNDPRLLQLLASCKAEMRVIRPIQLLETPAIHSPALMGIFRPRLLLPIGLCTRLSHAELRFVFLHELAHLKRHDIAIDWLLAILQTLHWFNPLIWLAFARARAERELARDAMVLAITRPDEETGYGQTILKLVESFGRLGPRPGTIGILEGNSGKQQLKRRITMIADFKRTMRGGTVLGLCIALLLIAAALTDKKATGADPPQSSKSAPADPDGVKPQPVPRTAPEAADIGRIRENNDAAARQAAKADAAMEASLQRRLPEVNFQRAALSDVIDFLRDVSGADIQVNWRALEAAGIERKAPVTVRLRNVQFSTALTRILDDATGGAVKLGYETEDGVLVIATAEELNKNTVINVYDIRDLLAISKDEKQHKELAEQLVKLLEDTIDPHSWTGNGGNVGIIKYLAGQLVVTQTKANHRKLVALLEKMRETRTIQVRIEVRFLSVPAALLQEQKFKLDELFTVKKTGEKIHGTFLDDNRLNEIIRAAQANKDATLLAAPVVMMANGQQSRVQVAQQQAYVSDFTDKIVGGERQAKIDTAQTGVFLEVTPSVSADAKYITVAMHSRVSQLLALNEVPWDKVPQENLKVQKPDMAIQEVNTIVSIPDGGTIALLLKGDEKQRQRALEMFNLPKDMICLTLLKPTIVMQREIEAKPPATRPAGN
jgi:bla regulator protein BlaR1